MKAVAISQGFHGGHIVPAGTQFEYDEKAHGGKLPSWAVAATKENLAKIGDVLPQNHGEIEVVPAKKKHEPATYKVATPTPNVAPNSGDRPASFADKFPEKAEETRERAAEARTERRATDRRGARTARKATVRRRARRASPKAKAKTSESA